MKKYKVPQELIGYNNRYSGRTYYITKDARVYSGRGTLLKETFATTGLEHPVKFGKNLWWVLGMMFEPNEDMKKFPHPVMVDGKIHWVNTFTYSKMIEAYSGKKFRMQLPKKVREQILEMHKRKVSKSAIAKAFGVSRMTVYRLINEGK